MDLQVMDLRSLDLIADRASEIGRRGKFLTQKPADPFVCWVVDLGWREGLWRRANGEGLR